MTEITRQSFVDIIKESILQCETDSERWSRIIDLISIQVNLIDSLIENLSPEIKKKIMKDVGFKEVAFN